MLIGVEDHWKIDIGDDLTVDELYSLQISDEVGLGIPTLKMSLRIIDENKIKKISEPGHKIKIGIGKNQVEESYEFIMMKRKYEEGLLGQNLWFITVWGMLDNLTYLRDQKMETFKSMDDLKNSNEVWDEIMKRNQFSPVSEKSGDKMNWIQYNITDRQFAEDLSWYGLFKEGDPLLTAIRRNGEAVFKPFSSLKVAPKFNIGNVQGTDFQPQSLNLDQVDGFMSVWAGSERKIIAQEMESGEDKELTFSNVPQIIGKGFEDIVKSQEREMINENVHEKWWDAYNQNRVLRASLASMSMGIKFLQYIPMFPLDYVKMSWQETSKLAAIPMVSGEWLVVRSLITLQAFVFEHSFRLSREAFA